MSKPKRAAKKTTDKTTQVTSQNTTPKDTTANEPVVIQPMVPRTAPLAALSENSATTATVSEEIIVQFGGKELSSKEVIERAKQAYIDAGKNDDIASINAYVKPEESKVYFVINNDYQDSFDY